MSPRGADAGGEGGDRRAAGHRSRATAATRSPTRWSATPSTRSSARRSARRSTSAPASRSRRSAAATSTSASASWPTTSSPRRPRGDLAKAIDYAQRAGAQDMEQLAYEDAVDVYGRALEVLELMDEPDEALRCSLLLSLGGAEAKSARVADAREAFERAAESARRLDDTDSLVGRGDRDRDDERRRAGSTRSSSPCSTRPSSGSGRSGPRAGRRCSARSRPRCTGSTTTSPSPTRLVERGDRDRPRGRRPEHAGGRAAPQDLHPRRAGRPARAAGDRRRDGRAGRAIRRPRGRAPGPRLPALVASSSSATSRRSIASWRSTRGWPSELRMPEHIWHTYALRGMRALLDGDIEEAERLAEEARHGRRPRRAAARRSSTTASR